MPGPATATNGVLLERISALVAYVERMNCTMDDLSRSFDSFERSQVAINARREEQMARLEKLVDEHDKEISTLKEIVSQLSQSNKLLGWFSALVGSSLIVWIMSQLLGMIK